MREAQIILKSRPVQENEFLFSGTAQINWHNLSGLLDYISSETNLKFEYITAKELSGRTHSEAHGIRVIKEGFNE